MITENIVLRSDYKKELKHLSIDTGIYVSKMLIDEAEIILKNNKQVSATSSDYSYDPFTMRLDKMFKRDIKTFCLNKNTKIKDFWNEAAYMAIRRFSDD